MSEYIGTRVNGMVLEIKIQRPEKKNALDLAMYRAMYEAIDQATADDQIRVILFRGESDCFTSGNDLTDFLTLTDLQSDENPLLVFMHKLAACPKVVVAAVEGIAIGIGTTMLLHCDFVYATPSASFKLPFVNLGLCPEYASSFLLPKLVGQRKAAEYLMLGRSFSAAQAENDGLINAVAESAVDEAYAIANELSALAPEALRQTKALMKSSSQLQMEKIIDEEVNVFASLLKGPEFAEAAAAFFEKRSADFSQLK